MDLSQSSVGSHRQLCLVDQAHQSRVGCQLTSDTDPSITQASQPSVHCWAFEVWSPLARCGRAGPQGLCLLAISRSSAAPSRLALRCREWDVGWSQFKEEMKCSVEWLTEWSSTWRLWLAAVRQFGISDPQLSNQKLMLIASTLKLPVATPLSLATTSLGLPKVFAFHLLASLKLSPPP